DVHEAEGDGKAQGHQQQDRADADGVEQLQDPNLHRHSLPAMIEVRARRRGCPPPSPVRARKRPVRHSARPAAHSYPFRYGSGLTGSGVLHSSLIMPSGCTSPMRTVLYRCCVSPSMVYSPSGASMESPAAAAFTASTSVEPAFSTALAHRCTAT